MSAPPSDYSDWVALLQLLQDAFAPMEVRIDPPSSVSRLTPASLAAKSRDETLFLARDHDELIGCVFARPQGDALYVGKLAVRHDRQRGGVARRLMAAVEAYARADGVRCLELETRIELTQNHATFAALGFVKSGEHAHEGYDRPTFISMRKALMPGTVLTVAEIHHALGIPPNYGQQPFRPEFIEARYLVDVGIDSRGRAHRLAPDAAWAWARMVEAARADGVQLTLVSGFRSVEYQCEIFRRKLAAGITIDAILARQRGARIQPAPHGLRG